MILNRLTVLPAGFLSLPGFVADEGRVPWSGRTVVKPNRGASSEDVLVFDAPEQALAAVTGRRTGVARLDVGDHDGFEVEEFLSGPIRHFDGLVQDGEVLLLSASEYLGTCLGYARGRSMGSFQIGCPDATRDWVARALAAVRVEDGSFHLEAIVHEGEPVFLEVGNRVGGADVVATVELSTGVHLPSYELRVLLGEPVAAALPEPPGERLRFGWFVHPGHHLAGREFRGLHGVDAFRSDPRVVAWNELPHGAALPDHITYQAGETVLAGIVGCDSSVAGREWMTGLFGSLSVRTGPATQASRAQVPA